MFLRGKVVTTVGTSLISIDQVRFSFKLKYRLSFEEKMRGLSPDVTTSSLT